ncbi:hypothetical protein B0T19DRAFT_427006 [Cercophora scortea]|uniref:Uncharacterized protein n=1 Tax=Cercophora scortea TaxID=314031 RepID=A0AAE0M9U2_9PEZI|nr:hypothetical protein B0T19DRAFT_427006 [Cercophora scortea]
MALGVPFVLRLPRILPIATIPSPVPVHRHNPRPKPRHKGSRDKGMPGDRAPCRPTPSPRTNTYRIRITLVTPRFDNARHSCPSHRLRLSLLLPCLPCLPSSNTSARTMRPSVVAVLAMATGAVVRYTDLGRWPGALEEIVLDLNRRVLEGGSYTPAEVMLGWRVRPRRQPEDVMRKGEEAQRLGVGEALTAGRITERDLHRVSVERAESRRHEAITHHLAPPFQRPFVEHTRSRRRYFHRDELNCGVLRPRGFQYFNITVQNARAPYALPISVPTIGPSL